MIKIEDEVVEVNKFPDSTLLLKQYVHGNWHNYQIEIKWFFENNEELVALIYLVKHLHSHGIKNISLSMPYIPNARQDRVKELDDVFTLKYFADVINWLDFNSVYVLDPHSHVSEALIDRVLVQSPRSFIHQAYVRMEEDHDFDNTHTMLFFPDEGAMKRYADMFELPYAFGIKKRDWATGKIEGLDVAGCVEKIKDGRILIVDDICSRGGTFYHSAKKLKELGAKEIYLYVTHCENTILEGDLLTSGLIEKVFTTNSIFTKEHEKIEVFKI